MSLAKLAGLLADPTRAEICTALLDGRSWSSGELARHAGVAPSTASEHLSRLIAGGLLVEERRGRHRYVRLADQTAAALIEDLTSFAVRNSAGLPAVPARPGGLRENARRTAEARARTCYDHIAGRLGVTLTESLLARRLVVDEGELVLSAEGERWLAALAIDLPPRTGRSRPRPAARSCMDWTERRAHLGGALGAALCRAALDRRWLEPIGTGRALRITPAGTEALRDRLGVEFVED